MILVQKSAPTGLESTWASTKPNLDNSAPIKLSERSWSDLDIYRAEFRQFWFQKVLQPNPDGFGPQKCPEGSGGGVNVYRAESE